MPTYQYDKDGEEYEIEASTAQEADAKFQSIAQVSLGAESPIDTSPLTDPMAGLANTSVGPTTTLGELKNPNAPLAQARQRGVETNARLPAKESLFTGLATNKQEKDSFVESYIRSVYPDAPVRMGTTGEIEFVDPETRRWTIATPGATSALAEIPEVALSTMGAIGGGALGAMGGPPGMAAGGAAGGAIGQLAGDWTRQKLGKLFGINESQTAGSMAQAAIPDAAITGAVDLSLAGVYGAGRGAKAWLLGRQVLKPHEASALLSAQKKANTLVEQINQEVGGIFNPSTAQRGAMNDSDIGHRMLSTREQVRDNPFIGPALASRDRTNDRALAMYYDNISVSNRVAGVNGPEQGGAPLHKALNDEKFNVDQPLVAERANAVDAASGALGQLPQTMDTGAGRTIRSAVQAKYDVAHKATQTAYGDYYALAGQDAKTGLTSIDIPWSDEVRAQQSLLKSAIKRTPLESGKLAKQQALLKKLPKDGTINLSTLDDTLKHLRKTIRSKEANKLGTPPDIIEAKRLESALENMRNKYLEENHPDVLDALLKAEKASFNEANTFKYGLTKKLLEPDGSGGYRLSDAKVVARVLKNKDSAAAEELAEILRTNPQAMGEAQNFLFALYRKQVDPKQGMIPNYDRHKKFMQDYGETVSKFFTPAQQEKLNTLGGFAEIIQTNTNKLKLLNSMWAKDFKGSMKSFSAEDLVEGVNSGRLDLSQIRKLKNIATIYGDDVLGAWKAGVAEDLRGRLFKGDVLDQHRLQTLVTDYDQMAKLRELYGPTYHRNLERLNDAMQMVKKVSENIQQYPKTSLFSDIARFTYAPPLSREGRFITFGSNSRARAFYNKIYKALDDPAELSKLASRTDRTMRTLQGIAVAGSAGSALADQDQYRE